MGLFSRRRNGQVVLIAMQGLSPEQEALSKQLLSGQYGWIKFSDGMWLVATKMHVDDLRDFFKVNVQPETIMVFEFAGWSGSANGEIAAWLIAAKDWI